MDQDNNNPVVHVDIFVVSTADTGAHNPFGKDSDEEVLNGILSFNGAWPCKITPAMSYRYETRRLFRVELFKMDYLFLVSDDATLGWSQYHIEVGRIISQQHLPTVELGLAERKQK
jgi:hypothetical protein